jgi:hypothetical protein
MTDNRTKGNPAKEDGTGTMTVDDAALDKIRQAAEARDALAAALTRAGIQLPAMDVRTHPAPPNAPRYALVQLGACSAPVALALADVITQGTGR